MGDAPSGEPASESVPTSPTAASPGPPGCAPLELLELHAPHAIDAAAHSAPSPGKVQIRRACMSCLSAGRLATRKHDAPHERSLAEPGRFCGDTPDRRARVR